MTPETTTRDRTITTLHDTGHDNNDGRAMLEISTSHYAPRKAYTSKVRRITKTAIGTRQKFVWNDVDPVPDRTEPTARYSEKALNAAHAAYIAEHNLTDPATLAPLIEWAKGA